MKAYVADRAAPAGVTLRDEPSPQAAPGVAVLSVAAASLNRGEVQHVRSYKLVPDGGRVGWDFAGVIKHRATDGSGPDVGTPVFGWSEARGSWATELAVRVDHLAPIPVGLSMVDASTLGVAALTAYGAVRRSRIRLSEATVLVTGSTGGVGLFTLQLAARAGARIIASVQQASDADVIAEAIGLPVPIEIGIDPKGEPIELIVDSVGGPLLSNAMERVAPDGTVVTLGRTDPGDAIVPAGWFLKGARLDGLGFSRDLAAPGAAAAALSELGTLAADGDLRTGVAAVLPAERLHEAMDALLERRVRGKVVITWGGSA